MAIKVNGTTVIDDSRNLSNVGGLKTVGGTNLLGSGDISVGASIPTFNPSATPNVTLNSSGTWTKPSLSSDTWVVIHMIGGGAGGTGSSWATGGNGGSAVVIGVKASTLPSSISFTVGAGGAGISGDGGNPGGNTTATINGRTYTAPGAVGSDANSQTNDNPTTPAQPPGSYFMVNNGTSPYGYDNSGTTGGVVLKKGTGFFVQDSIFGGAAGAGTQYAGNPQGGGTAGTSTFAGDGGTYWNNGSAPGGGGGARGSGGNGGNGGSGGVRIWYIS